MSPQPHPYTRVAQELKGTRFSDVRFVDETESTNADVAALLGNPQALGRTIVAEHQTRGRGRKGRTWISQPGASLMLTTILPIAIDSASLWIVPFWAGLAVHSALLRHGIPTMLQWPNDVLIPSAGKVAGILCVSRITGNDAWAGCGVGINVRRLPAATAAPIEPPAAYCDDVASVDRASLLLSLLREYDRRLVDLGDAHGTARAWEKAAGFPGAAYRLLEDGAADAFEAKAVALAGGGGLIVQRSDGRRTTVALADARVLRN